MRSKVEVKWNKITDQFSNNLNFGNYFIPDFIMGCDYISMLGLKLTHVCSKKNTLLWNCLSLENSYCDMHNHKQRTVKHTYIYIKQFIAVDADMMQR